MQKSPKNVPAHVLIIPDGTRRFAQTHKIPLAAAYKISASKIAQLMRWVFEDFKIQQLTIYALSQDNIWHRKYDEVSPILQAMATEAKKAKNLLFVRKAGVRIRVLGKSSGVPLKLRLAKQIIEGLTSKNSRRRFNVLLGYSGQQDILEAVEKINEKINETKSDPTKGQIEIDKLTFLKNLWLDSPIDLVIRTGEQRLSDCPLYQISYAELFFLKKCFPELTKSDIKTVMAEFAARKRRYGG